LEMLRLSFPPAPRRARGGGGAAPPPKREEKWTKERKGKGQEEENMNKKKLMTRRKGVLKNANWEATKTEKYLYVTCMLLLLRKTSHYKCYSWVLPAP
jgi:hypothetical protein